MKHRSVNIYTYIQQACQETSQRTFRWFKRRQAITNLQVYGHELRSLLSGTGYSENVLFHRIRYSSCHFR
ncbi:hypothetical protein JMJ77_0013902, partial [Colletotrichum scovillei]